jgi:hypothetical protein
VASLTAEVPCSQVAAPEADQHENPPLLTLARGPPMSVIEQWVPLKRGHFFNRDCEKVDGKTS